MLTPIVCMLIPFAFIAIPGLFGLAENVSVTYFALLGLSVFPTADGVLTVVFVRPYGRHTGRISGCGQSVPG